MIIHTTFLHIKPIFKQINVQQRRMAKTQETASVDFGDELQKIYKVQPRLLRLHLNYYKFLSQIAKNRS